jgi:hypothetical protein
MFRSIGVPGIVFLFLLNGSVRAQDTPLTPIASPQVPKTHKHNLGFAAGFSTGYGLSYRFTPNRFGVQATFSPLSRSSETRISAGLTFLFTLVQGDKANLFLYQGNHILHRDYEQYHHWWGPKGRISETESTHGLGVGIEFILSQRVGFNLMGGYALYDEQQTLDFTGETGLYYKF